MLDSGRLAKAKASGCSMRLTLWLGSTSTAVPEPTATTRGGENEEMTSAFVVLVTSVLLTYVWLWLPNLKMSPTASVSAVVIVPPSVTVVAPSEADGEVAA